MANPKTLYKRLMEASTVSELQEIKDFMLLSQLKCHLPCKVISVDYGAGTVSVEIQGKQDMGYGAYETFPVLSDIPILEPHRTSRAYILTPIKSGDTGMLEFLDFNCSNFNADGNTEPTEDPELHSINSSVFINGYIPQSNVTQIYTADPKLNNVSANKGMIVAGNIDLYNRPVVKTKDGAIETVKSMSFTPEEGKYKGKEVLIPTISPDGKEMSENEAIEYYYKTGQHLGIFENPESATTYAIILHNDQDRYYNSIGCPITIGLNNQTFTLSVNEAGRLEIKASDINIKGDKINIEGLEVNFDTPTVNVTKTLNVGYGATGVVSTNSKTLTFENGVLTNVE